MQSSYSAGMKRCGICMEERGPLWGRRSKSEETLCRLLITMMEETFDIRRSWVDHGKPIMNLKSGNVEGEYSKWKVKQRKMICDPFLRRHFTYHTRSNIFGIENTWNKFYFISHERWMINKSCWMDHVSYHEWYLCFVQRVISAFENFIAHLSRTI